MVRKFLPKYDFEIYNIQTGVSAWFLERETAFVIGAANYGGQYIPVRRTSYTNCANTMRLRKHNATAQTQCDCANTMRLRKHNATTQIQCDYANTMRLRKYNALGIVLFGGLPKKLLMCIKKINRWKSAKNGQCCPGLCCRTNKAGKSVEYGV